MTTAATPPVFVLARTPGATDTVEWTDICHRKEAFVFIGYRALIHTSRWVSKEAKRPFVVYWRTHGGEWSRHATLDAAIKAANKLAKIK